MPWLVRRTSRGSSKTLSTFSWRVTMHQVPRMPYLYCSMVDLQACGQKLPCRIQHNSGRVRKWHGCDNKLCGVNNMQRVLLAECDHTRNKGECKREKLQKPVLFLRSTHLEAVKCRLCPGERGDVFHPPSFSVAVRQGTPECVW